jgi:hypothetical protein
MASLLWDILEMTPASQTTIKGSEREDTKDELQTEEKTESSIQEYTIEGIGIYCAVVLDH